MRRHVISLLVLLVSTCFAGALTEGQGGSGDAQRELREFLATYRVAPSEIAKVETGQVVTAVFDGGADTEIFVAAAVKIRVPRAQVTSYYGQMIAYVDGQVTQGFAKFSSPAALADVRELTFDRSEVDQLKSCRPGNCDIRLGGVTIEKLRSTIDWKAADYVERTNDFVRKAAVDYITAYRARGDAALVTYDDRAQPISLKDQWRGLLGNSPLLRDYAPELAAYLERFPAGALAGGRDVFYWVKEDYGYKPVVSIVHGVVYDPPARPGRTIVAQKQLYANHYFDGSLAVAVLMDTQEGGRPATYLVYANRSRGDMLKGGFGGVRRSSARSMARKAAEETLGTIKRALESAGAL
jgi:hypothetical protein